ncbi:hypothetical protein EIN_260650 [Entamoeba invadens IP1]|uniref:Uncharacterized protein n=1 Tax=Entamoeba invadens IP1 TaxID=370355 RepID=L7FQV0_ENTIV|nr:hypothetical protein EIN_260650 [Entamoeba invadens IP1]ELP95344.1 hypothetical protein EIN_260650 [Entamoeba invadens IP1]|eukprot:XP_004262115.1 hypothetical protein EIN_260650 [Entamoeba invadens IP1]
MGILCMQSGAVTADAFQSASGSNTNVLIPNTSTGIQSFNFILEWEFNVSFKGSHAQEDPLPMTAPHLLMLPTANVLSQTSAEIVKPIVQPVVQPQMPPDVSSLYVESFTYISPDRAHHTVPLGNCMAKSYSAGSFVSVTFSAFYTLAVVFSPEGVIVFNYTGTADHVFNTERTNVSSNWYLIHTNDPCAIFDIPALQTYPDGRINKNFSLTYDYSKFGSTTDSQVRMSVVNLKLSNVYVKNCTVQKGDKLDTTPPSNPPPIPDTIITVTP